MGYMFNIEKIIKESGLSDKVIKKLEKEVREEFPTDEMMYELHLMRAIESEKNKGLTIKEKVKKLQAKGNATLRSQGYKLVTVDKRKKRIVKSAA